MCRHKTDDLRHALSSGADAERGITSRVCRRFRTPLPVEFLVVMRKILRLLVTVNLTPQCSAESKVCVLLHIDVLSRRVTLKKIYKYILKFIE